MAAPILLFGTTGQLARELIRLGPEGLAGRPLVALDRTQADLARPCDLVERVRTLRPAVVINAAAYTAVDRAETDAEQAFAVNRDAPSAMAAACAQAGAVLIHVSTGSVFDGQRAEAYDEDAAVAPLSVYGRSKAEGEAMIRRRLDRHVILRTSWLFSASGTNFVRTLLRLGRERDEVRVVDDQTGGPTPAAALAAAIAVIAGAAIRGQAAFGTFHFQGAPAVTWRRFAEAILAAAGDRLPRRPRVVPVATRDHPTPARRPAHMVLDCTHIARAFGIAQPDWRAALIRVVDALLASPVPARPA